MCPVNTAAFEVRGKRGSLFDSLFFKCKELGDDGFVAENGTETEIDRVGGSTGGNNLNPVACPNNTVFNKIDSHVFGTPLDASIRKGTLEIKLCCDKYGQQMYFDNNKCMSSFPIILNGSGLLLEDSSKHISLLGDQYSNYSLCAPVYTTFNNGLDGVIWLTDSEDNKPFIYSEHNEQCPSGASSWMISNYIPRVGNPINVQFEYDESNNKCPSRFYILTTNITINNTDDFVNQFLELSGNYSSFGSWVSDSKTIYDNGLYIAIENRGAPFKLRTLKVMSNNNTYDFTEISSTATEMTSTATKMTSTATEMTSTTTKMTSTTTKMTSTTTEMSCSGHIVAAFLSFAITMCLLTYL
ncbi:hypothetical protein [Endozoicomonas sp. 8E]|uniref:hypothetical protein n=1 Tax=Endozoicomonas sp. 8E TaxID=3035692 RepID=UPI00293932EC|nr:hypothetical protein [Endozoicomonas sp. 8E]WOG29788.1 hypothetical protein P6910_09060 [Endozoicomonas sp. 8E]